MYVRVYVRIYKCKFCWFRKRCILAYFVTCSLIINYVIVISWRALTKSESSRWYVFWNSMFYYRYAIVHSHNSWRLFEFYLEYDNEEELFSNSHVNRILNVYEKSSFCDIQKALFAWICPLIVIYVLRLNRSNGIGKKIRKKEKKKRKKENRYWRSICLHSMMVLMRAYF